MAAATACGGRPSPDWNGTWQLNPAKSDLPGPTIVISITPDGLYNSASSGGDVSFRCDGKENAFGTGTASGPFTFYCRQESSSDIEVTIFRNGSKSNTQRLELSPDEKVLTIKTFQADGSVKSKESTYTRTSGSTGFAGGWRNENPFESTPSIWQISLDSHGLHWSFPQQDQHGDAVLDGSNAVLRSPASKKVSSIALKGRGPREIDVTKKRNGELESLGYWRISADGRSLTSSYWVPAWPNQKVVLVYDKQ
jgi:hypothetical protein